MSQAGHAAMRPELRRRERIQVRGLVQGVGFRPHVYRCAQAHGVSGWVRNDGYGVTLEVEGDDLASFVGLLKSSLPPLARIDLLERFDIPVTADRGFRIVESDSGACSAAAVPADAALCDNCLRELFDVTDRRYLHPFIACSDCGPRYTMSRKVPYDRCNTTMSEHAMCAACRAEYEDPLGRRLHAEPIACHDCGPALSHSLADISAAIRDGKIVALKGIGGFHLVADGRNADAIERLRLRKGRSGKPFALMMLNSASVRSELIVSAEGVEALQSFRRPILVAQQRSACGLPSVLGPALSTMGVMLPYTGIHYLLFWSLAGCPEGLSWLEEVHPTALLMTSANVSGDPILSDEEEACAALAEIADIVVTHNRRICGPCDDSVLRDADGVLVQLRRSRGFVPDSISLAADLPPVLGLGAHLKNTVCAIRGRQAHMTPHLGDMESVATRRYGQRSLESLMEQLQFSPAAIACDLHPDYASTMAGEALAERLGVPLIPVQHHHAHAASVLALANWQAPALALTLDGHGLGRDGGSWGGELLRIDGGAMQRLAHLRPLATPGGDRAAEEPWRMAVAALVMLGLEDEAQSLFCDEPMVAAVASLARAGDCPQSSAAGRWFDAAAGLLGVCRRTAYEAEAPMRLESLVRSPKSLSGGYEIDAEGVLDLSPLMRVLGEAKDTVVGAELFHGTLIDGLEAWVSGCASREGLECVALSGGCFANFWLARYLPERLEKHGIRVLAGWDRLPPGDGGLSLGQAYTAALSL